jgi:ATP-binding protein involved in chromosome partitioning
MKSHLTQLPGKQLRGIKNTIAIGSGKGGVGKSTVTVNLAAALTQMGARVGILDADIYGPSIPQLLGSKAQVQCKGDKYLPIKAHGIQAMSIGYLTEQAMPLIWRGPMLAKSMIQLLDTTLWDDLDYLLIDLPPGTGDIQLSLVQKIPLTGAIIVTTPQTVATADAEKALCMFQKTNIHVLGIVENMAEHICSACGHTSMLFGAGGAKALAETHQVAQLGQLPLQAEIRENADTGTPTYAPAFDAIAQTVEKALSARPLNYADKFPPIVVE